MLDRRALWLNDFAVSVARDLGGVWDEPASLIRFDGGTIRYAWSQLDPDLELDIVAPLHTGWSAIPWAFSPLSDSPQDACAKLLQLLNIAVASVG